MTAFIESLRSEITRLEEQLVRAQALLRSYEAAGAPRQADRANDPLGRRPVVKRPEAGNSKEERVHRAIIEVLSQRGPLHRSDILAHVESLGFMGHEARPLKTMGVYLSKFRQDVEPSPDGIGMWRLRESRDEGSGGESFRR
jgi:hypothetical protein